MTLDLSVNSEVSYSNDLCESNLCEKLRNIRTNYDDLWQLKCVESIINFEKRKFSRVHFLTKENSNGIHI